MPKPPNRNNDFRHSARSGANRRSNKSIAVKDLLIKAGFGTKQDPQAAGQYDKWYMLIRAHVAPELMSSVTAVTSNQGKLTVFCASAAWATRMRYALAERMAPISAAAPGISSVTVKVRPAEALL